MLQAVNFTGYRLIRRTLLRKLQPVIKGGGGGGEEVGNRQGLKKGS